MKIRTGFVSNSSSSSFIIQGKDTFFPYEKIELNSSYKAMLKRQGVPIDVTKEVYLSKDIYDADGFEYNSNWNYKGDEDKKFNIFEYIEYGSITTIEIEERFAIEIVCDNKTDVELNIFKLLQRSLIYYEN